MRRSKNVSTSVPNRGLMCRNRIAVYKAPCLVEFVDFLPRNPAGKILKRELRAREQKATEPGTLAYASEGR
jgi:acyl-CoA synthetase (AMP-forming)/AMP-acid ligase II